MRDLKLTFLLTILKNITPIAFLACSASLAYAAEPGYSEAMEYFVHRENQKNNSRSVSSSTSTSVYNPSLRQASKIKKFYLGLGQEKAYGASENNRNVTLGATFLKSTYVQSSLELEWRPFIDVEGETLSLMYSVQLPSGLFFLGPEIAFGGGRSFSTDDDEGFTSLRLGLNLTNAWSQSFLASLHFYYRRDQGFKTNFHEDRVGVLFKIGL